MRFFHIEISKIIFAVKNYLLAPNVSKLNHVFTRWHAHKSVHKLKQTGRYETFKT